MERRRRRSDDEFENNGRRLVPQGNGIDSQSDDESVVDCRNKHRASRAQIVVVVVVVVVVANSRRVEKLIAIHAVQAVGSRLQRNVCRAFSSNCIRIFFVEDDDDFVRRSRRSSFRRRRLARGRRFFGRRDGFRRRGSLSRRDGADRFRRSVVATAVVQGRRRRIAVRLFVRSRFQVGWTWSQAHVSFFRKEDLELLLIHCIY